MASNLNFATSMVSMLVFSLIHASPGVVGRNVPLSDMLQLAGYGEERLSTVLISGSILCHARSSKEDEPSNDYVAGAKVGVSCYTRKKGSNRPNWVQVTSDAYGEFIIDLPSHLHAISNLEKSCVVKVVSVPRCSRCHPFFTGKRARGLKLSSKKDGIRTYTVQNIYLTQTPHKGKKLRARKVVNGALKAY